MVATGWIYLTRRNPRACPFGQRTWLDMPRPFMRRQTLIDVLRPQSNERILEVGPGTGYCSLVVAPRLAPHGRLDVVDTQQDMLDELRHRRLTMGIDNVLETLGDARQLSYPDATFDAAFLVATLGEIPDKAGALHEISRVLKPHGRLVVGEGQPDPHMVTEDSLRAMAQEEGYRFDGATGTRVGYFARFVTEP
jgi:ubiquinone/menaquinone biosynthesis C-methylase UbiE